MFDALAHAIETARSSIPIQRAVVREECLCGYTIVRGYGDILRVYQDSAWTEQHESLLPWSAPLGEPVARVALDGSVTYL